MRFRLGIDVGGTFTDFAILETGTGRIWTHKHLTTPDDPARGVMLGLAELIGLAGLQQEDLSDTHIVHGTTLFTNALIERKGARVALLTTQGIKDVLETGKENRYDPYDRHLRRPEPLVPRHLRLGVSERLRADGTVLVPLDREVVLRELRSLVQSGVEGVAVCFLHAYKNPEHEQAVRELVRSHELPLYVSLSSEVAPEIGEFERVATTAANVYIQPIAERYLMRLDAMLKAAGYRRGLFLMLSDGGIASPETALKVPIRLLESGPAAGALATAYLADRMGLDRVIAFDMGGTTAKICLIDHGIPEKTGVFEVGRVHRDKRGSGLPVRVPTVEMLEIGAGGGSIARLDSLGLLKVGPDSAGANPGPACYGMGGLDPTVTDANLLLGYLTDGARLGKEVHLSAELAVRAHAPLASGLGVGVEDAAAGVRRVVTEAMAHAAKLHTTERGQDPRRYTLMAFGGAGPLHACEVARTLGVARVVVPKGAGTLAAFGFLTAPPAMELIRTFIAPADHPDAGAMEQVMDEMAAQAREALRSAGVAPADVTLQFSLDMRHQGQGYDVTVQLPWTGGRAPAAGEIVPLFHRRYREKYAGIPRDAAAQVRSVRLWATGPVPEVRLAADGTAATAGAGVAVGSAEIRRAYSFISGEREDCVVHLRDEMSPGVMVEGPALIQEGHTTTVLDRGCRAELDAMGNLMITVDVGQKGHIFRAGEAPSGIDLEIMLARLRTAMDEADVALLRTAFSTAVRDAKDYSLILSDLAGNSLALPTECMPLFVTAMPRTIGLLLERFPSESLADGDVIITNDPWLCAGHKSDITLVAPVFYRGKPVGFMGVILHIPDVGGVIGDFRAWDLHEEGLMIPPMKLYTAGRAETAVFTFMEANTRMPVEFMGDLSAMETAIRVGAARLTEFLADTGLEDLSIISEVVRERSREAFRREAARVPAGEYRFEVVADGVNDPSTGEPDAPIHIKVAVRSNGAGDLVVDYTGTSDQIPRRAINVPIPYTIADTIYAIQFALAPALPNIGPQFNPVRIIAPPGCILNAQPPVPVFARTRTGLHVTTAIFGALGKALPELSQAGSGHNIITRGKGLDSRGQYYHVDWLPKGGMGAIFGSDGHSCTVFPTNCTMINTEVAEQILPVLVEREMLCDSGGPGCWRGGLGQRVLVRSITDSPLIFSVRPNFLINPAPGLEGGHPGKCASVLVNGEPQRLNPVILQRGDILVMETAGGGGFGDPRLRDPNLVRRDVRHGLVSVEAARDLYGVPVEANEAVRV